MKNILTIIKKEFSRFFRDKRMVITVLLPGVLIFVVYTLIGSAISDIVGVDENYKPSAYLSAPSGYSEFLSLHLEPKDDFTEESAKQAVAEGKLDVAVIFPENFNETFDTETPPEVRVYYNSSVTGSAAGFQIVNMLLSKTNRPAFTINSSAQKFDLASERDLTASITSMLVPMLMFSLLASACISVAPESIAGEKERGTMATMLITPIRRVELAIGKILSLSCFALLSGISSFIGVILSLPKLTSGFVGVDTAAMYSVGDYFMVFGIIISVVLLIISAFSVMSAFAKSVKEAGTLIAPLMILIILMGMASMFFTASPSIGLYLIPLLGSGLAMASIMSFSASGLGVALSIISNIVLSLGLVVLLTFMFKSERIMFKK